MLVLLLRHWQTVAAFAAGAAVGALLVYAWANAFAIPDAREQGRELERAAMAVEGQKAEMERKRDDARLRSMSDFDLCVEYLRDRGMPIDACASVRGLHAERPVASGNGGSVEGRP